MEKTSSHWKNLVKGEVIVRMAAPEDAAEIYTIYEPYILNTVITFEYDKIPVPVFQERIERILKKFPWLVCIIDGRMAGYAYCSPHLERAAFGWDCECSVYLNPQYQKKGIGTALYEALLRIVKEQGVYNMYSLICVPHESSVALHKRFGFTEVGTYYNTAYKHGQWRHLLVMEKRLKEELIEPAPIKTVQQLATSFIQQTLREAEETIKSKQLN